MNGPHLLNYLGPDGTEFLEELRQVSVPDRLLHATPDENVARILEHGLLLGMPAVKSMVQVDAIFCTIPSNPPNTNDLFRYYIDWSIVVLDTSKLPGHIWYVDFLATDEALALGKLNNHVLTLKEIPAEAIVKILKT